jgi:hypothetical protein
MRQIDFELKTPMDDNLVGWKPWLKEEWDNWLTESTRLLTELAKLDSIDAKEERNKFIDANSDHWRKLKPWLKALSHGKCWYTEGREICSHFDVEHFRPKKEAGNGNGTYRDAYWWLAFDYSNYRLSGNVPNRKKDHCFLFIRILWSQIMRRVVRNQKSRFFLILQAHMTLYFWHSMRKGMRPMHHIVMIGRNCESKNPSKY